MGWGPGAPGPLPPAGLAHLTGTGGPSVADGRVLQRRPLAKRRARFPKLFLDSSFDNQEFYWNHKAFPSLRTFWCKDGSASSSGTMVGENGRASSLPSASSRQ